MDALRRTPTTAAGIAIVATAASLWATDVVFRQGLTQRMSATELVFWEHVILAVCVAPLLLGAGARLRTLDRGDWLAILVIGGGASVLATILFTKALSGGDFTTPLLLQKLQPVFAVTLARGLLRERLRAQYVPFLLLALLGSYLLLLNDLSSPAPKDLSGPLLAIGAALLWACGTVLGKRVGTKLRFSELTALRFTCGLPIAFVLLLTRGGGGPLTVASWSDAPNLLALALIPGLLALLLYYRGLQATTASTATLAELAFPATALIVNAIAFGVSLNVVQVIGLLILVGTVTAMPIVTARRPTALALEGPAARGAPAPA